MDGGVAAGAVQFVGQRSCSWIIRQRCVSDCRRRRCWNRAPGVIGFVPAAARLAADGDVAGSNPGTDAICGVAFDEGSVGAAERATADVSSGAVSCFHQAQRGPDWQPNAAAIQAEIVNARKLARCHVSNPNRSWKESATACAPPTGAGKAWYASIFIRHAWLAVLTETLTAASHQRPRDDAHACTIGSLAHGPPSGRIIDLQQRGSMAVVR